MVRPRPGRPPRFFQQLLVMNTLSVCDNDFYSNDTNLQIEKNKKTIKSLNIFHLTKKN